MFYLQQLLKDNAREYHETLAHPPLYTHPNPVNVAILGGGDGGVLREVLKYSSVETVTLIDIDPVIVEIAREHFSFVNDCSGLEVGDRLECNSVITDTFDDVSALKPSDYPAKLTFYRPNSASCLKHWNPLLRHGHHGWQFAES